MQLRFLSVLLLMVCFVTSSAQAAVEHSHDLAPLNLARWYKVHWGGLYVGNLIAEAKEVKSEVKFETIIESRGMIKKLTNFSCFAIGLLLKKEEYEYQPKEFNTICSLRKRVRNITLEYEEDGSLIKEVVTPPDIRTKRPAVSDELKEGAVDPITAAFVIRGHVKKALDTGRTRFTVPIYDGRRQADFEFTIMGKDRIKIKRKKYNVIHLRFHRVPIAGFSKREYERMGKTEPDVDVYLSDDELLLPVKTVASAPLGYAVAYLHKECETLEAYKP